jgi:hypothetical protein
VDLIVPFHGQYERLSRLIQSLWDTTQGIYYNLCLVDDGSPNKDFMDRISKREIPSVICIRHEEQRGFGAAINSGIGATKSPWVVILNSDVEFDNGFWLAELGKVYQDFRDQNVKMVSARYSNAPLGDKRVEGKRGDHVKNEVILPDNIEQILDQDMFLPFVCVLAHRELFARLGPIKEYPLGWYEDLEFACRMHCHGFKQAISARSFVLHAGAATVEEVCTKDKKRKKIFEKNFDLCCEDIKLLIKEGE